MQPQAYRQHLVEELEGEGEGEGVGVSPGGGGHIQLHPEQRGQLPAGTPDIQLDEQQVSSRIYSWMHSRLYWKRVIAQYRGWTLCTR